MTQQNTFSKVHVFTFPHPFRSERHHIESAAGLTVAEIAESAGTGESRYMHAFLDGHPEVLHVPHTFKFYDFVAANPELLNAEPRVVAERFAGSPMVASLFDSSRSVIIGGRLGPGNLPGVKIANHDYEAVRPNIR